MLTQMIEPVTNQQTSKKFFVREVLYITNDGNNDILVNLDTIVDGFSNRGILLKPNETVGPLKVKVDKIHYYAPNGESTIRAGGIRNGAY